MTSAETMRRPAVSGRAELADIEAAVITGLGDGEAGAEALAGWHQAAPVVDAFVGLAWPRRAFLIGIAAGFSDGFGILAARRAAGFGPRGYLPIQGQQAYERAGTAAGIGIVRAPVLLANPANAWRVAAVLVAKCKAQGRPVLDMVEADADGAIGHGVVAVLAKCAAGVWNDQTLYGRAVGKADPAAVACQAVHRAHAIAAMVRA